MIINQKLSAEKILILIDNSEKMDFFSKIIKKNNIRNTTFIHTNLYTFKVARQIFPLTNSILLKRYKSTNTTTNVNINLSIEEAKNKQLYHYDISKTQGNLIKKYL